MNASRPSAHRIEPSDLQILLDLLNDDGYEIVGPTRVGRAIEYRPLRSLEDLPVGWTDVQSPGSYRLEKREDEALFGFNAPQNSWKDYLFPPRTCIWRAKRDDDGGGTFTVQHAEPPSTRYAFVGVRPCEWAAIRIQDRIFAEGKHKNPDYRARREDVFIAVVGCTEAGGTCFCASMDTGPGVDSDGYDLSLLEVLEDEEHYFLVESGSPRGETVLEQLPHRYATKQEFETGRRKLRETADEMGRRLDTRDLVERLYGDLEHPRWDDVAERCLSCGNCTLVCPTCFCSRVQDTTCLDGSTAERWRCRDVCFTKDFSFIHGGSVRSSLRSRYRQWLTHKLASWVDQFGVFGCVGCGRCITWCPVGIDITEEAAALR